MFNDNIKIQTLHGQKKLPEIRSIAFERRQKFESSSTIKSNEQEQGFSINVPNYAVYQSGENYEEEKVLINKAQLVTFTQCFAQEKISLENTIQRLKNQNHQLHFEVQRLQQENKHLRTNESVSSPNTTQYYEAVQSLNIKLKQEFQKRMQAERQLHGIDAVVFELKKKNEFLVDKLKHQQDQVQRCEQLLKIKEDIILNFEWEKAQTARNREKQESKLSCEKRLQNHSFTKTKKSLIKTVADEIGIKPKQEKNMRTQVNQTLDLSEINFYQQSKISQQDFCVNESTNPGKKLQKYAINKKVCQNESKKKLNISVRKRSNDQNLADKGSEKQISTNQKSKPKGIVLKKNMPDSSSFMVGEDSQHINTSKRSLEIQELQKAMHNRQQQFLTSLQALQRQNESLKTHLFDMTQGNLSSMNESKFLKPSQQNQQISQNSIKLLQKKYDMMRQKCLLLQGQIQKTIRKYILAEERNKELEAMIQSSVNSSGCKPYGGKMIEMENIGVKPGLSLQDLVTPQFRESKFSNNFFGKNREDQNWNCENFQNIAIQDHKIVRNHNILDTFDKNEKQKEMSAIQESKYQSHHIDEIQDVSEIVCRNQEELAMGDTFDL